MKLKKKSHRPPFPYPRKNSCSSGTIIPVEIVTLEDNSYHLIVKVEIDGIQGEMIIDTGASVTVVDRNLFSGKAEGQSDAQMQSCSISGQIAGVHLLQADCFKIGRRKIRHFPLAGIDLDYINDIYSKLHRHKIIGLLGCDFCVRYEAVIDYRQRTLSIKQAGNEGKKDKQTLKS